MTDYPTKIRMLQTNDFGQLGQMPMNSYKGRVYELVPEPSDGQHRMVKTVQAFANTVSGDLPEGYEIQLSIENGAAWISLCLPNDDLEGIEPNDEPLVLQIIRAVKRAREHKEQTDE